MHQRIILGPLRSRHQDRIKCARNLLGGTSVGNNCRGVGKCWERHQVMMQLSLCVKEGSSLGCMLPRLPSSIRKVGQGRGGDFKPMLLIRGVLHLLEMGLFDLFHAQPARVWEQPMGNVALVHTRQWTSEPSRTFLSSKKGKKSSNMKTRKGLHPRLFLSY